MNGNDIFVGILENYDEAKKIKVGSVITVKHSGVNTYGKLLFPRFFRERTEVKWDEIKQV